SSSRIFSRNGILYANSNIRMRDLTDGSSNTVILGESRYFPSGMTRILERGWASTPKMSGGVAVISAVVRDPINFSPLVAGGPGVNPDTAAELLDIISRGLSSHHTGGCHVTFGDGSVRFLSENMDEGAYHQIAIRGDGLPLGGNY
ncbi:MAG TPA: DUF1559 domain-containing protein, partial [Planctomicrobium sp.]|nr:DUF1559 domain-containing protein [Planctomicrobium sp.]